MVRETANDRLCQPDTFATVSDAVIDSAPPSVHDQFNTRHAEAADLYSDF